MKDQEKRRRKIAVAGIFFLIITSVCGVLAGSISLRDLSTQGGIALTILLKIRLPRVLLGLAAGASLGVSGAGFQAVFRNALADPFIIGASSGASLGAAVAMIFPFFFPFSASLFAFFGGLAAVFTAWGVSRSAGNPPSSLTLLLAGTCVSSLCSGVLALLLIMKDRNLQRVYYWSLGSLAVSWDAVLSALPFMATGCLIIFLSARAMDLLLQGDETAESLGLDVKKARFLIISGASLAASATVSVCGIIGFAGLAAPHIARIFMGPVHRRMSPASALAGALLVALADILSRVLAPPLEIPIGVIMTLAGAPFFLYLIVKYGKNLGIRN